MGEGIYRRIEAGTDIATIGAWDASHTPVAKPPTTQDLRRDATDALLFFIETGSDGGGPVDVYVDREIPAEILPTLTRMGGEYLIVVPSGKLIVGGVEDYRAAKPRITGDNSIVTLPAGDYVVQCFAGPGEEADVKSEKEIAKTVGAENVRWYDRMNGIGAGLGCLTPIVVFVALVFFIRWYAAVPIAILSFLLFFHGMKWVLQRNPRYSALEKIITPMRLELAAPTFVLHLRKISDRADLVGGFVTVE